MREIKTNGFETIDGCLDRHDISTTLLESVLQHKANRHLATLSSIIPARTVIYVPAETPAIKEVKHLWD